MTARLLLDQNIPRSALDEPRRRGLDVVHAAEVGMARALDDEILDFSARESRVVVTFDADFHQLIAARRTTQPSVVRIRAKGLSGHDVADTIEHIVSTYVDESSRGVLITVRDGRVRVRGLPLQS